MQIVNSPTARTMQKLKAAGFTAQVVERFCPFSKRRIDLYGFIDVLAICAERQGVLGIQATSQTNAAARCTKIIESELAATWLLAGNALEVWGWSKKGAKGKRKLWKCDRRLAVLFDGVVRFTLVAEVQP